MQIPLTSRTILTGLTFAALALVSGCATLSESQCVASDWETVGYRDGLAGTQSSQLLKHQNACVKHGVVPDRDAYLAGWDDGVRQYCMPENGFSAGEHGKSYNNVCPEEMQTSFYAAYQEGRQLYVAQSEINGLNRQISQKEHRLKQIATEISSTEARLVDDSTEAMERRELLDQTKELAQEQGQLETEIQDLKVDVALKSERLKNLRQTLAYAY
jgi:gas vesicle protein